MRESNRSLSSALTTRIRSAISRFIRRNIVDDAPLDLTIIEAEIDAFPRTGSERLMIYILCMLNGAVWLLIFVLLLRPGS
ncbi:hypothetical protein [Prosthecomicrobium hirschii]|uniref:hypothetical protein n=1 Tax=Prosthecodimorpha hirschii TaxID=665126 RepID=UPI00128F3566|nr:hypothetical protein [Prosthecomicrobium hirschii]MCW1842002.1 hypothetical protein [Prosthecomicrobium hirschii]